ncbi:MAG: Asp-tRNA(Asn)/Glu-tRNA(Gln) amidotransferase subunit GatB [Candidatus Jorgensenbacteria bacterium]
MYLPTIGLEIHVELKTATKMFCGCRNNPEEPRPNVNVCPICLAHPGTLPVPNREAIGAVLKLGMALGGTIAEHSHFDRKSYFYPDLPKGYQISQYEEPLVTGGTLDGIRITRVHLEEDTARLLHEGGPSESSGRPTSTLVDFNRAGVPLMELVTEPDVKNAREAVQFARDLQRILRYLGISDGDMEKGHMRVEANISIAPMNTNMSTNDTNSIREISGGIREHSCVLGTKVEVKNLNSFRAVEGAIAHELERQERILHRGEKVVQETRGWDDKKGVTVSQRSKESAHDYRYFPEPDIPPLNLAEWDLEKLRQEIPELPEAKRKRFETEFGFAPEQAELVTEDMALADYFEQAASELKTYKLPILRPRAQDQGATNYQLLYNYFTSDLKGLMNEKGTDVVGLKIEPEHFAHLVALIAKGELTSRLAKDLLAKMFATGEDPETLMRASGTKLIGDEGELEKVVADIIAANPKPAEDFKKGKTNALQFLVGQAMTKTKGQASPEKLRELFARRLG